MSNTTNVWRNALIGGTLLAFSGLSLYLLGDSVIRVFDHFHTLFGPVFWLLLPLMILYVSEGIKLLFGDVGHDDSFATLKFIEVASPTVGLLGSVLALINGFSNLNLTGGEFEAAINTIVHTIAVSLATTACGLTLNLLCWILRGWVGPKIVAWRLDRRAQAEEAARARAEQAARAKAEKEKKAAARSAKPQAAAAPAAGSRPVQGAVRKAPAPRTSQTAGNSPAIAAPQGKAAEPSGTQAAPARAALGGV